MALRSGGVTVNSYISSLSRSSTKLHSPPSESPISVLFLPSYLRLLRPILVWPPIDPRERQTVPQPSLRALIDLQVREIGPKARTHLHHSVLAGVSLEYEPFPARAVDSPLDPRLAPVQVPEGMIRKRGSERGAERIRKRRKRTKHLLRRQLRRR